MVPAPAFLRKALGRNDIPDTAGWKRSFTGFPAPVSYMTGRKRETGNREYAMEAAATAPGLFTMVIKSVAVLFMVLALMILVLYLAKRLMSGRSPHMGQGIIRMKASLFLSPRERIVLVEVGGENLLLGVTPNRISRLSRIRGEIAAPEAAPVPFADVFRNRVRLWGKKPAAPEMAGAETGSTKEAGDE